MRLPWSKPEIRSNTYTGAVLDHLLSQATGTTSARVSATAALEAAAGFVSRAFASANVVTQTAPWFGTC